MKNILLPKIKVILITTLLLLSIMTLPFTAAEQSETTNSSDSTEFPYPGDDWAWSMIGTEYAHQKGVYGEGVVVAVLDTGIDYTHPDLEDKMWDGIGYDFVDNNEDPMDEHGHGTHVAGIIASVAPGAELMALRVIAEEGGDWVDVSRAIEYARDNGADIISMSFGGQYSVFTPAFELQMERAYNWDDILHVAAAGNDDTDERFYPAGYESVISVSAVDSNEEKAYYSNYGDWIELTAPGGGSIDQIYSTLPDEDYGDKIGTSMACPFVTGVAALRRSLRPEESNDEVREVLHNTAIDLSDEYYYGNGLVDAYRASGGEVPTPVLELEAYADDSMVELSWQEPWSHGASPIEGFRIYRGEYGEKREMIGEADSERYYYEDTDVENEVTYQYTVTAYNDQGESFDSEVVHATPRAEPVVPSNPRNLEAELQEEHIILSWEEPLDDGGSYIIIYHIYRKVSGGEMERFDEVDVETNVYLDREIELEMEYTYAVTAENEVGESEKSGTATVFVPEDHGPPPPKNVSVELSEDGVEIDWHPPDDDSSVVKYNIYRKESGEEFVWLGENETTSYLDKTVGPGLEYTYAITSESHIGESEMSFSESILIPEDHEPPTTEPSEPREVSTESIDGEVEVAWEKAVDDGGSPVTSYKVYRKETEIDDDFQPIGEVDGETFNYLDGTVSSDSEYIYAVTAENEVGESEMSYSAPVTVPEEDPSPEDESWTDWITEGYMPVIILIVIIILIVTVMVSVNRDKPF